MTQLTNRLCLWAIGLLLTSCAHTTDNIENHDESHRCRAYRYTIDIEQAESLKVDKRVRVIVIDPNDNTVSIGHSASYFETCKGYGLCVVGMYFYFVFPKNWEEMGGTWEYNGVKFALVGRKELDIGNHSVKVFVITVVYPKNHLVESLRSVYFSPDYGIVGFEWYLREHVYVTYTIDALPGYSVNSETECKSTNRIPDLAHQQWTRP